MTQSGNGTATSTYDYDYMGSRVLQTAGGLTTKYANKLYSTNGATTTKYIYAGGMLVASVEKEVLFMDTEQILGNREC